MQVSATGPQRPRRTGQKPGFRNMGPPISSTYKGFENPTIDIPNKNQQESGGNGGGEYLGKEIAGYKILRLIGFGGFSYVYEAVDKHGSRVALKIYRPLVGEKSNFADIIVDEARQIAKIQHENIVKILDAEMLSENQPYVVMEYLEGNDLGYMMRQTLSIEKILDIMRKVCLGLGMLHAHGVIHRDVKPANMFYTNDRVVKVIDFDISRVKFLHIREKNKETIGIVNGTAAYISPELALGMDFDHRVDVYSSGIMMYKMVCGEAPFDGSPLDLLSSHVNLKPMPPRLKCPGNGIPENVEQIIMRALEKKPEDRFPDMYAMRAAILRITHECPSFSCPKLNFGL
jgi:serine/threonine-protein kinase